jgi:exopolysaccharide production protein ExoQ
MSSTLAALIFGIGIAGLFFVDREQLRVSKALWIPTVWLFFCSSRSVPQWLGLDSTADQASVYLEGSPSDRYVLIALEVMALIVVLNRAGRVGPILRRNWAVVLFFVYALFSMAWSDYPLVTFKHWTKGIGDLMMVLIVLTESDVRGAIRRLFTRIGFLLVPLSLLFIRYYPWLGRTYSLGGTPEAIGVTTQKNGLGVLCDCIGLALIWRFRSAYNDRKDSNRVRRLVALGAVLAIIVWLLEMCNSLTSICALSMASCVMLLSTRPALRRRPSSVHLLVAGVLVCTLYALFFQSSGGLVQSLGRDPTLTGRTEVWPQLINLVKNPPVGVGYESFWLGERLQKVWVITNGLQINEAHNGYVEILLTLGWIGLFLLGVLIATGYRNLIHAFRRDPYAGSLRMAWFLAALITGFTEASFRIMNPTWFVFLLATTASSWSTAVVARRGSPASSRPQAAQELTDTLETATVGF